MESKVFWKPCLRRYGLRIIHLFLHARSFSITESLLIYIVGDLKIGYVGEIGPQIIEKLSLKIQKPQVVVFEIDLDHMLPLLEQKIVYHQIPRYPSIDRDVALVMDDQIAAAEVVALFRTYPSEIIEHVELFDHYKGKNLPQEYEESRNSRNL